MRENNIKLYHENNIKLYHDYGSLEIYLVCKYSL